MSQMIGEKKKNYQDKKIQLVGIYKWELIDAVIKGRRKKERRRTVVIDDINEVNSYEKMERDL